MKVNLIPFSHCCLRTSDHNSVIHLQHCRRVADNSYRQTHMNIDWGNKHMNDELLKIQTEKNKNLIFHTWSSALWMLFTAEQNLCGGFFSLSGKVEISLVPLTKSICQLCFLLMQLLMHYTMALTVNENLNGNQI